MIKLRIGVFLLITILFCQLKAQTTGDSFAEASASKQARLSYVYNNATDFAKENKQGVVSGVLVDLMKEFENYVSEEYGITTSVNFVRIEQANFAKFLTTVQNAKGGVFGLSNTSISEERKRILQFSPPFLSNITVLVTHKNVPDLISMEAISRQFGSMKAFSVTSSVYLKRLEKIKTLHHPGMEIDYFKSGLDVIEALAKDEQAYAIIDLLYYLGYLQKGYPIKRHKIGDEVGNDFGIIMPLKSDWKPILDEFFATGFTKSPRYREIVSTHLSKSALRLIK
ncbi:MAG: transporter substrate-binding domain-containing protein [Cyclobacteriaceae bacterium]